MTRSWLRLDDLMLSVALVLVWSMVVVPAVAATDFGSDFQDPCSPSVYSQCTGENYDHRVRFFSVDNVNLNAATHDRMTYYGSYAGRLTMYEVTSSADVHVQDLALGATGWWAATYCSSSAVYGGTASNHTRWCKPQILTYNTSYSVGVAQPYYLACHELGHTVGLRHYSSSCMAAADLSGDDDITPHERDHLNARYGN